MTYVERGATPIDYNKGGRRLNITGPPPKFSGTRDILLPNCRLNRSEFDRACLPVSVIMVGPFLLGFRLQVDTHVLPRLKKRPTEPGAPVEETPGDQVDLYEPERRPGGQPVPHVLSQPPVSQVGPAYGVGPFRLFGRSSTKLNSGLGFKGRVPVVLGDVLLPRVDVAVLEGAGQTGDSRSVANSKVFVDSSILVTSGVGAEQARQPGIGETPPPERLSPKYGLVESGKVHREVGCGI